MVVGKGRVALATFLIATVPYVHDVLRNGPGIIPYVLRTFPYRVVRAISDAPYVFDRLCQGRGNISLDLLNPTPLKIEGSPDSISGGIVWSLCTLNNILDKSMDTLGDALNPENLEVVRGALKTLRGGN